MSEPPPSNFDVVWKLALDLWLEQFFEFFFPKMHRRIDWTRTPESLDTELNQIVPESERGRMVADKLVRVFRKDGREEWVLIHIEVQSQVDQKFAARMFDYYSRIRQRFGHSPVSLAILGDDRPNWRPRGYRQRRWGCGIVFRFPSTKLLDFLPRLSEIETDSNLFGLLVAAHLATISSRGNTSKRYDEKLRLARRLYARGLKRDDILRLFAAIDFVMRLPKELAAQFRIDHHQIELEYQMKILTQSEELAIEETRLQTHRDVIGNVLAARFGSVSASAAPLLAKVDELARLDSLSRIAATAKSYQEFLSSLAEE